jgi:peptide/nickel transport system substrate-binding protein
MPADTRLNAQISKQMGLGYWADAPVYNRDVDKAKSLLAEAGATNLTLDIATPSISTAPGEPNQVMQLIQSQLKDAGINVTIIQTPPDRYIAEAGFGALAWGFFGGAPDPYYQFEWFTCDQIGVWNFAAWCNKQFTSLEGQLAVATDEDTRNQIAIQMQQIQDQDAPIIWIGTQILFAASKSNLQAVFDTNGNPVLQYFHTT